MDKCEEKIKFPFKCPVCDKDKFIDLTDYFKDCDDDPEVYKYDEEKGEMVQIVDPIEIYDVHCSHCGWTYDLKQVLNHDIIGDRNKKTVNELKIEYQNKLNENPKYNYDREMAKPVPHKCPICGEYNFKDQGSYDICRVCGWIDDGQEDDPLGDDYSEVNVISVREAKLRFNIMRKINPKYKYYNEEQEYEPTKIKPNDINTKLIDLIPNLKDTFESTTKYQDGFDTGSSAVIEDVFMVYLKDCIKNKKEEVVKCVEFVEWLADYSGDEYVEALLVTSIFEYIHYASDREELENVLGPKAKSKYDLIKWK